MTNRPRSLKRVIQAQNIVGEVLSGSGTSWTFSHTPVSGTIDLKANGVSLELDAVSNGFTVSGTTATTTEEWDAGAIIANYRKQEGT